VGGLLLDWGLVAMAAGEADEEGAGIIRGDEDELSAVSALDAVHGWQFSRGVNVDGAPRRIL
jgi:hypothetical protein